METTKLCKTCNTVKDLDLFHKMAKGLKGRGSQCKICRTAQLKTSVGQLVVKRQKLKKYGLTIEQFDAMVVAQEGKCAICKKVEIAFKYGRLQRLSVDHDHIRGNNRELLCQACNHLIGKAYDNPDILLAAAKYLEKWND